MSRDTSSTRLIRANLMTPLDSPNGRRWTHCDAKTGKIVEAYGFDLSPIGLHAEFVAVVARAAPRSDNGGSIRAHLASLSQRVLASPAVRRLHSQFAAERSSSMDA